MEKKPNKSSAKFRLRDDVKAIERGLGREWLTDIPGFIPRSVQAKGIKVPRSTPTPQDQPGDKPSTEAPAEEDLQEQIPSDAQVPDSPEQEAVAEQPFIDEPEFAPFQVSQIQEDSIQQQPENIDSESPHLELPESFDEIVPIGDRSKPSKPLRPSPKQKPQKQEQGEQEEDDGDLDFDPIESVDFDDPDPFPIHPDNPFARLKPKLIEQQKVINENPIDDMAKETTAASAEELLDSASTSMESIVGVLERMTEMFAEMRVRMKNVESQLDRMGF